VKALVYRAWEVPRTRRHWFYPFDLPESVSYRVATMRREGLPWAEIGRRVGRRPGSEMKTAYKQAWRAGIRPCPQDGPEWFHQHERFGEYPPSGTSLALTQEDA